MTFGLFHGRQQNRLEEYPVTVKNIQQTEEK